MAHLTGIAPVFPVRSMEASCEHYAGLGFQVERYDGAPYAFLERDGTYLHLAEVPKVNPKKNLSAVFLYVDDADALFAEWDDAKHAGKDIAPESTDYGLREGAHLDPDGNLLRYGSPIHNS